MFINAQSLIPVYPTQVKSTIIQGTTIPDRPPILEVSFGNQLVLVDIQWHESQTLVRTVAPIPAMIPCGTGNFCGSFLLPRHALNRSRLIMLNGLIFFLSFWFSLKLLFLMFFPMAFYVFLELSHSPLPPIPRISPTAGRSSFHHHFLGHASTAWCHRWARPHARRAGTQSPLSCYGDGYFRFWVYIMGI